MKYIWKTLLLVALCLSLIGEARAWPLPEEVLVGTDPVSSDQFTLWKSADFREFEGTYSSDVGGDSTGTLEFRIDAPGSGYDAPCLASGAFKLQVAGEQRATTMKFENATCHDLDQNEGIFNLGAFRVVFVKLRYANFEEKGVVIGEVFLKREKPEQRLAFIDGESNFRTGPGTKFQVKFQPREGTAGTVVRQEGNWIMIQLDNGDSGWAYKQNLRPVE